jgi:hypothetical protein
MQNRHLTVIGMVRMTGFRSSDERASMLST